MRSRSSARPARLPARPLVVVGRPPRHGVLQDGGDRQDSEVRRSRPTRRTRRGQPLRPDHGRSPLRPRRRPRSEEDRLRPRRGPGPQGGAGGGAGPHREGERRHGLRRRALPGRPRAGGPPAPRSGLHGLLRLPAQGPGPHEHRPVHGPRRRHRGPRGRRDLRRPQRHRPGPSRRRGRLRRRPGRQRRRDRRLQARPGRAVFVQNGQRRRRGGLSGGPVGRLPDQDHARPGLFRLRRHRSAQGAPGPGRAAREGRQVRLPERRGLRRPRRPGRPGDPARNIDRRHPDRQAFETDIPIGDGGQYEQENREHRRPGAARRRDVGRSHRPDEGRAPGPGGRSADRSVQAGQDRGLDHARQHHGQGLSGPGDRRRGPGQGEGALELFHRGVRRRALGGPGAPGPARDRARDPRSGHGAGTRSHDGQAERRVSRRKWRRGSRRTWPTRNSWPRASTATRTGIGP
ncbi:MAG: hypothetical protein MZV63_65985 [Marinilabiliales bacterium]|nr:hypothetical protein [Marinilabiliales bacterium]